MRIGVISDTHDRVENGLRAVDEMYHAGAQIIVHCGDWKTPETLLSVAEKCSDYGVPFYTVLGNNDIDTNGFLFMAEKLRSRNIAVASGELAIPTDGTLRVVAYHGHHVPTLRRLREDASIDILLLGHTHKPKIEEINGRLIVNPGSLAFSIPRSKNWRPSYAVVDTDTRAAMIAYLP